jgi:hypothetical protein
MNPDPLDLRRPFHNHGVDAATLAHISAPPIRHRPRGGYVADPKFARRSEPHAIRKNSERSVLPPVDPIPAREARAARAFDALAATLDGTRAAPGLPWKDASRVHVIPG